MVQPVDEGSTILVQPHGSSSAAHLERLTPAEVQARGGLWNTVLPVLSTTAKKPPAALDTTSLHGPVFIRYVSD